MFSNKNKSRLNKISIHPGSGTSRARLEDRIRGSLLGLAAGDRIGGPTRMALLLGESLTENRGYVSTDVEQRYVNWWSTEGFDTGAVSDRVFRLISKGMPGHRAVKKVDQELHGMTAGCNPVHRSVAIALSANIEDSDIAAIAQRESRLTHANHLAGLISASSVDLIRMLIKGADWPRALMKLENTSAPVIHDELATARNGKIHPDGYSPHVLGAAIHFVDTSNSFDEMLERAIDFAGDENYCPVLAGVLGGARWGVSAISDLWLVGLKDLERIKNVGRNLMSQW